MLEGLSKPRLDISEPNFPYLLGELEFLYLYKDAIIRIQVRNYLSKPTTKESSSLVSILSLKYIFFGSVGRRC